ncbi:unnamed protein product [Porites evermanni]|uniref:Uncharacterized protein n=1 Tax=Porites evermanni TaxID=104178 RepID=A0ABN8LW39_9CNID|nr:unnamed protein product [Porites evermanni]
MTILKVTVRKLNVPKETWHDLLQSAKIYIGEDGNESDKDTFSAFNPGSTFICAVGKEIWSPSPQESNTPASPLSSIEVNTIKTSHTVTVAHTAKVGAFK